MFKQGCLEDEYPKVTVDGISSDMFNSQWYYKRFSGHAFYL